LYILFHFSNPSILCPKQFALYNTQLYLYVFHQCLYNTSSHFEHNLTVCLEIWKSYCRRVYESPVAQNCNVTARLFLNGVAARNLVSLFTIYGPTKFISSSKPVGVIRGNFWYFPLYSWNFKFAHKLVPLYTDFFLYKSVCYQRLSRRFLLLDM
jgi:hypothetical protein